VEPGGGYLSREHQTIAEGASQKEKGNSGGVGSTEVIFPSDGEDIQESARSSTGEFSLQQKRPSAYVANATSVKKEG